MWYIKANMKPSETNDQATQAIHGIEMLYPKTKDGRECTHLKLTQGYTWDAPFTFQEFEALLLNAQRRNEILDCRDTKALREKLKTLNRPAFSGPTCAP